MVLLYAVLSISLFLLKCGSFCKFCKRVRLVLHVLDNIFQCCFIVLNKFEKKKKINKRITTVTPKKSRPKNQTKHSNNNSNNNKKNEYVRRKVKSKRTFLCFSYLFFPFNVSFFVLCSALLIMIVYDSKQEYGSSYSIFFFFWWWLKKKEEKTCFDITGLVNKGLSNDVVSIYVYIGNNSTHLSCSFGSAKEK